MSRAAFYVSDDSRDGPVEETRQRQVFGVVRSVRVRRQGWMDDTGELPIREAGNGLQSHVGKSVPQDVIVSVSRQEYDHPRLGQFDLFRQKVLPDERTADRWSGTPLFLSYLEQVGP
jgi:hypothetical protein